MSVYTFDIDLTISETEGNDYPNSKPKPDVVKIINNLYDKGHTIKIFTGRGSASGKDWRALTVDQLKEWGVKYHYLIMGKPDTDYFIDDKALSLAILQANDVSLINIFVTAFKSGNKILVCGNGGLAADAAHFSAEMMGKYAYDIYLPCFHLGADPALVTALANDIGFENVFSHQVKTVGQKGDIFIGMTTSQSKNVVKACEVAKDRGLTTIMLCGRKSQVEADYVIRMEGKDTAEIQNNAIQFLHALAYQVKKHICEG